LVEQTSASLLASERAMRSSWKGKRRFSERAQSKGISKIEITASHQLKIESHLDASAIISLIEHE
jgi:hypothetical protein